MRSAFSIVKATAQEVLSEPLSLLVLLAALAIAVLAPAFHYHQFGEATRMARDAGLSSLLTCGAVLSVFGTIRTFRREIESGTLEMALSHPVSRAGFFLSKLVGAIVAYLAFALIVLCVSLAMVAGAAVGGEIARRTGDVARVWGPCFAAGMGVLVLPLIVGAGLNRFANCRFVLSCFVTAGVLSALSAAVACAGLSPARTLAGRLMPAFAAVVLLTAILQVAAAALAVRLKANAAASATGVVLLLLLPVIGNYYLSDALSNGGSVPWSYVGRAGLAALPELLFFLLLGIRLINGRDIST